MGNKTYCPILTIGFGPPEEGKRDLRLCMRDCAWYDVAEETCKLNVIAERLEYILTCVDTPPEVEDEYEYIPGFNDPAPPEWMDPGGPGEKT